MPSKICSKCKEEKDFGCFTKSKTSKTGLFSYCKACKGLSDKKSYQKHRDIRIIEKHLSYKKNKVVCDNRNTIWNKNNPEKIKIIKSNWKKRNKDIVNASYNKRRSIILEREKLLTEKEKLIVLKYYTYAQHLQSETGIKHEVDHYFPLRGKQRKGFHTPQNLVVLPRIINQFKGRKDPTDLPKYMRNYIHKLKIEQYEKFGF